MKVILVSYCKHPCILIHISVHRDIKPTNILLVLRSNDVKAVLSDFDASSELYIGQCSVTTINIRETMSWIAPELICNKNGPKVVKNETDLFFPLSYFY